MLPLVLIHAFPLNGTMWAPQRAGLSAYTEVITPDLPGFGEMVPLANEPFTIARGAAFILSALDARGIERCVLGGLSMGGYIAFECWRLFGHRIAGLILADTRAAADTEETRTGRMKAIERIEGGDYEGYLASTLEGLLAEGTRNSRPDLFEQVGAMEHTTPASTTIAALKAMAGRVDSTALLPYISVPLAAIVGEHDSIISVEETRSMAEAAPHGELHVIPEAGHLSNLENSEAFNAALLDCMRRAEGTP